MKTHVLAGAIVAGLMALATSANAVPIAAGSTLSLNGSDNYTPTSITFLNPANIGAESGSFSVLSNCIGCVTMTSFTTATATPFTMYTATEGAISTALSVTSKTFDFVPGVAGAIDTLTVMGAGTLTLTGFDPTPGNYVLTTQGPTGVNVTFSVTSMANAVPEPASLAILGGALAGFGLLRRRRRS
jgi:hypothetical protein